MTTYYVRKDRALDGSEGPPDGSGLFYWFDGSDAAASDPNAVWTDETNADDSDIATVASTSTAGSEATNYLQIEGTNAPASGGTISSVEVWIYFGPGVATATAVAYVYEDGNAGGTELDFCTFAESPGWAKAVTPASISAPGGGWTWAALQGLEVRIYTGSAALLDIAAIGVMVHTTTEGESTANPFRTIDEAADAVAAADTVVVGAGVYRELVTMDTAGTNGSEITFVADVDGALGSGDPGLVIISAYADEQSVATRASCLNPNEKDFIIWRGFVMTGGTDGVVYDADATTANYEGCVWEDCVFISGHFWIDTGVVLDFGAALTPTNNGPIWRRCTFLGAYRGLELRADDNETAEADLKVTVESCVFYISGSAGRSVFLDVVGTGTYAPGGIDITNCLFQHCLYGVYVDDGTSTTYPVAVTNSLFSYCNIALYKVTSNDGALTSAYNTFASNATEYTNVTAGTGDRDTTTDPGLMGGVGDYPLHRFWGWSPYRPWEPIRTQDDGYVHSVIGDGDTSTAAATDLYDDPKPMYGTVDDRGAVEGRARPEVETTTVDAGTNAVRFEGAGFHDFLIPVTNASTTVTVKAQFDASYTGTLPELLLMNGPGLGEGTPDVVTTGSGTWDTLSINFTPTEAGIARVRIRSNDTSATGECFFDTLAVT